MSDIKCRKCGSDLENWNNGQYLWINHCPNCGVKLLKKQRDALRRKTTDEEVDDRVRGNLLDALDNLSGRDLCAGELAERAWESENADGVVFYSNYEADKFVMRHAEWVDEALEYVSSEFGDAERFVKMKSDCNDTFLVVAFIEAARKYLYDQLGIDQNEGSLSVKRIREIKKLIKENPYACKW